ncbi:hypothetical protein M9458_021218 [Cirrhinus mrigala]|uniref:Uncharacterized protein n=1 Tax=Cirrhinus mrigala TaxID=683832 RepID=A0ABD0Q6E8_CIRMR
MSLSKSAASSGDGSSRAYPAACGALIAAKDLYPFCVVCLGLKHAEEALLRRPCRTLKIAVIVLGCLRSTCGAVLKLPQHSVSSSAFLVQMGNTAKTTRHRRVQGAASLEWADYFHPLKTSYVPQSNAPAALPQSILLDVCERAAAHLNIEWPAPQSATDQERDVYDGKLLGPPSRPITGAIHLTSNTDMAVFGIGDPPAIEPSIARYLSHVQGGLLAPPKLVLANKMDRFSASVHQAAYKSSTLSVSALNVSSLLSAYQAELLDDLGQQLDKGSPSPTLWKEILTVNDLVLRNARQAAQACGALWLNLSVLSDSEKRCIAGTPVIWPRRRVDAAMMQRQIGGGRGFQIVGIESAFAGHHTPHTLFPSPK